MTKYSWVVALLGLTIACFRNDTADVRKVVAARVNHGVFRSFQTGKLRLDQSGLNYLRAAEARGLWRVPARHIGWFSVWRRSSRRQPLVFSEKR